MVKLHPCTPEFSLNHLDCLPTTHDLNLQIPLSNLYSQGALPASPQPSFNDLDCLYSSSPVCTPSDDSNTEQNTVHGKSPTYHIYKYSRRERDRFFARRGRPRMKASLAPAAAAAPKPRLKLASASIFATVTHFTIQIPTKILARQRPDSPFNQLLSPLLFAPHFHSLVQLPSNEHLTRHLLDMRVSFQLLHAIASQEFHTFVHNYEQQQQQQHEFHHASLVHVLRETMISYTVSLPSAFKRNHSQSFQPDEHDSPTNHETELSIPPLKIRRHDDSSYEIEKRSGSSSSSSSGMSITQVHNGHHHEDRRRFETRPKKFSSRISDNYINSNSYDADKRDCLNVPVGSPLQGEPSMIDYTQSKE